VLIGLGSNRGDSRRIVREALQRLKEYAEGDVSASHLWQTSPVDCPPDSGDFINAAAAFQARSDVTPESLLGALKALEKDYGRDPNPERNAPRELDLDLLLFGDQTRSTDDFTLPHPRAVNRLFVLAPAAEVLPDVVWPGTQQSIDELLKRLETDEQVVRLEDDPE
jgi:2-amino-4-hydroxy-6-hydroxymethyldihydropteridine diphosphokinase